MGHPMRLRRKLLLEVLEDRNMLTTCTVDRLTDLGQGSGLAGDLRYCITQATSGEDTITFKVVGTINLIERLPDLHVDVRIEGPGADQLTVRPNERGAFSIFHVPRGASVLLSGLTIADGGYICGLCNEGTLTVSHSTFSDNEGGAGIGNVGTLTVSHSTFSGNRNPDDYGGGIFNAGTLNVSYSTFSGNQARYGGGIANLGTLNNESTLNVSHSTFAENEAADGGGIFNDLFNATLTVSLSTFSGNRATHLGGGLFNFYGRVTVRHSTLTENEAGSGGGIYDAARPARLDIWHTILAGNSAAGSGPDLFGGLTSSGYNLIGNSTDGSGFHKTDLLDVDPMLGPLQDNGGPTWTHALLDGSPAIDAGDNTDAPDWDQRGEGFPRIVGILNPDNPVIDIGAYEVQADGQALPSFKATVTIASLVVHRATTISPSPELVPFHETAGFQRRMSHAQEHSSWVSDSRHRFHLSRFGDSSMENNGSTQAGECRSQATSGSDSGNDQGQMVLVDRLSIATSWAD